MNTIQIEYPIHWKDYELIDSGDGLKLERFGNNRIIRPDPRALWKKHLNDTIWNEADNRFLGKRSDSHNTWDTTHQALRPWNITYLEYSFLLKFTNFKHVGIFPEQAVNWDWLSTTITNKPLSVLNLFGYTGAATIVASKNGAKVTHVDSDKYSVAWAKENALLNKTSPVSIRWIEEDAYKFVLREGRRGNIYDGIIMDPPRFGRGSKGEVWKITENLPRLIEACREILSPSPRFFLINAYTADLSSLVIHHLVSDLMKQYDGEIQSGELALQVSSNNRLLPSGIFSRWTANTKRVY